MSLTIHELFVLLIIFSYMQIEFSRIDSGFWHAACFIDGRRRKNRDANGGFYEY